MREIIFDTETTGFRPEDGERVIELGAIEFENRVPTGKVFHEYLNPEGRKVDPGAFKVHGLSNEFLSDKKPFSKIYTAWVEFVGDADLVAHNAAFDVNFLNHEFARVKQPPVDPDRVIDTLEIARKKFPMGQNSLDRLCDRFKIDNSRRTFHGALLDSELLSEVYIELLGGRQSSLELVSDVEISETNSTVNSSSSARPERKSPQESLLSEKENVAHTQFVDSLGENAIWNKYS